MKPAAGKIIFYVHFVLLCLTCTPEIKAQNFFLRNYLVKDGLPSSEVYCALQDKKGFMWFATDAGIARFDGTQFLVIDTENGLPDNTVLGLCEDRNGRIWFRTWTGHIGYISDGKVMQVPAASVFIKQKKSVELIISFYIDSGGTIWFGTTGNSCFYYINPPYTEDDIHTVNVSDGGSYISIIDSTGLIVGQAGVLNNNNRNIAMYSRNKSMAAINCDTAIYLNKVIMNPDKSISAFYKGREILIRNGAIAETRAVPGIINYKLTDNKNNIWICAFQNGAWLFSPRNEKSLPRQILPDKSVTCCIQDREGGYWITTLDRGVFYLPSLSFICYDETYGLPENKVLRVHSFGTDSFAAETGNGDILIFEDGRITNFKLENYKANNTPVKYKSHFIPLSSHGGSWIYYYKDKILKPITCQGRSPSLKSFIKNGNGTVTGFMNYILDVDPVTHNGTIRKFLPDRMLCCYKDYRGTIWLGGLQGLYRLEGDSLIHMASLNKLFANRIEQITGNAEGDIAVATRGAGFLIIKNGAVRQFKTGSGIASNMCRSIVTDSSGAFWIGSNKGITRIKTDKAGKIETMNFSIEDGLISNEVNRLSVWGNVLWIATNAGIAKMDINRVFENKVPPLVYITGYAVNSEIQPDLAHHSFKWNQDYFEISYTAISFHNLAGLRFRYKMEGLDTNWRYTNNRTIQYTSLRPGKYTFKIYAINANGINSLRPAELSFSIEKPLWKRTWFIVLLSVIGILLVFIAMRARLRYTYRKEEQKTAFNKKIAETELKALRAQMNPHFIFNAINSIQTFILKNDMDNAHMYLTRFSKLIRNVLENSENEKIKLKQEIETLDLYLQIEALRFGFKFNYKIVIDSEINKDIVIPAMIIHPYIENAIWHGLMHKEGERNLTLEIRKEGHNFIHCIIDDDGIGRQMAAAIQARSRHLHKPMGMQITRERLEILNKQYGLHTSVIVTDKINTEELPAGTKVEIFIPINSDPI